LNSWTDQETLQIHFLRVPRARAPVRQPGPGLMSDEVREEVSQNSEQRQTRNTVGGQNPRSTAFKFPDGRGGSRGLVCRGNDRGPIFHAKTSSGKIVAQVRYASRLPRVVARQDYLSGILPRIYQGRREKCDLNHSIYMQNICLIKKTAALDPPLARLSSVSPPPFLGHRTLSAPATLACPAC
jgi:hypothetical protein